MKKKQSFQQAFEQASFTPTQSVCVVRLETGVGHLSGAESLDAPSHRVQLHPTLLVGAGYETIEIAAGFRATLRDVHACRSDQSVPGISVCPVELLRR